MKYSIMHINNRAKKNMDYNKNILKDFEYCDIEYFDGIKGNAWDVINHRGIRTDVWQPYDGRPSDPLPGEYGVWLSTIIFWEYMVNNNIDKMLLIEDDVLLDKDFVNNFSICIKDLPKNFDFLSLYYFDGHNWIDENTEIGSSLIHKSYNQFSAGQATLYSLSGAKKILKLVKRLGIEYTSDCFIFRQSLKKFINGYSIKTKQHTFLEHDYKKIQSLIDPENNRNTYTL